MKKIFLILSLISFLSLNAKTQIINKGKLTYIVNHSLKTVQSTSINVKGKLVCENKECNFLVASPIKSFKSKDGNRDVKTWELMKADLYPLVLVRGKAKQMNFNEIEIELSNKKKIYKKDKFYINIQGEDVTGFVKFNLSDFEIEKPSLLGFSIDDEVRVEFELKLN